LILIFGVLKYQQTVEKTVDKFGSVGWY